MQELMAKSALGNGSRSQRAAARTAVQVSILLRPLSCGALHALAGFVEATRKGNLGRAQGLQ